MDVPASLLFREKYKKNNNYFIAVVSPNSSTHQMDARLERSHRNTSFYTRTSFYLTWLINSGCEAKEDGLWDKLNHYLHRLDSSLLSTCILSPWLKYMWCIVYSSQEPNANGEKTNEGSSSFYNILSCASAYILHVTILLGILGLLTVYTAILENQC